MYLTKSFLCVSRQLHSLLFGKFNDGRQSQGSIQVHVEILARGGGGDGEQATPGSAQHDAVAARGRTVFGMSSKNASVSSDSGMTGPSVKQRRASALIGVALPLEAVVAAPTAARTRWATPWCLMPRTTATTRLCIMMTIHCFSFIALPAVDVPLVTLVVLQS